MNNNIGIIPSDCVLEIIVYYENLKKEDIIVSLIGEIQEYSEVGTSFGYYTNVTSIPNIISDASNYGFFKKINRRDLILYNNYGYENINYTSNLIKGTTIQDKHYKYNFIILPFTSSKGVRIIGQG